MSVQCATAGDAGAAGFAQRVSGLAAGFGSAGVSLMDDPAACLDLLDRFMAVSDGRSQQAREHPAAAALTLAAAAVLAGMRSFIAIAGWVRDVAPGMIERLYARCGLPAGMPSRSTVWRVLTGADARGVDQAVGAWLAARYAATVSDVDEDLVREALMVDGKTLRGALDADGHLLAVATHRLALVLAQTDVGAKTNEIPKFSELLDELDIAGWTVTADALHTQRAHATYLHGRDADFVFMLKDNQPNLVRRPQLPGLAECPHRTHQQGHRPRPHRDPHHPGHTLTSRPAVPPRQPGLPRRAGRHRPTREVPVQCGHLRCHQPHRPNRRPRHPGPVRPRPLGNRGAALDPRRCLP